MRILILLITLISSNSFAWDNLNKELETMNVDMRHMWSGGHWQTDDQEGFYRFLVAGGGYEHYKSKLFIQWVVHGTDMNLPKILKTIGIKELNDNPLYAFNLPTCINKLECTELEIIATHTYELTGYKFNIKLNNMGNYVFTKVPM